MADFLVQAAADTEFLAAYRKFIQLSRKPNKRRPEFREMERAGSAVANFMGLFLSVKGHCLTGMPQLRSAVEEKLL
ncbi:hypothetical protein RA19_20230 [Leisingera sp. ANG-M1]|nr:hypothetical protein RA19_20230 [Leisingera sp. ANG-M1]